MFNQPSIFLAASGRADPDVVHSIREVLEERADGRLKLVVWNEMDESGPISTHIVNEISRARFGVCYLSESVQNPAPRGKRYQDNRNVLFEAGMLEALRIDEDAPLVGWVPIRESVELAGDPPFDIANLRMVFVPRAKRGRAVKKTELKRTLASQLDALINAAE